MPIEVPFVDREALAELERLLDPPEEEIDLGKGKKMKLATAKRVGQIGGLLLFVYADEHPPPHVCVRFQGESANFRISDGSRLVGGLARFDRHIIPWITSHKDDLIQKWNDSRPSDCPVGKYREPTLTEKPINKTEQEP